eukprot:9487306-Pyramimonas_sp.AAC.1
MRYFWGESGFWTRVRLAMADHCASSRMATGASSVLSWAWAMWCFSRYNGPGDWLVSALAPSLR